MDTQKTYGLMIERKTSYGTEYVIARVVCREPDADFPKGCSSDGESPWDDKAPKFAHGYQYDGIAMHGFISDFSDCAYIGFEPEYRDVYSVELPKAVRMLKTLRKIVKAKQRVKAYEAGDVFVSLAKALHLTFVCWRSARPEAGLRDSDQWVWANITEGRNHFRHVINQAREPILVRLGKKAA
jgi:hypothetical protein